MDPGHYALLLLAVGLAVMVVEVFVPSGGLLAVLSLGCLGASVAFAAWEWWGSNMLAFWAYVGCVVVLIPATLGGSFFMLPRTEFGRRLLQEAPTPEETASFTEERAVLAATVGRRGAAVTLHNPGGMVEVNGARFHAEARGLMLDPGEPIDVIGVRGNRLLVRRADAAVPAALSPDEGLGDGGPAPAEQDEPAELDETVILDDGEDTPVAPVVVPAPNRPGGRLSPEAPVGYANQSPPPNPPPTDLSGVASPAIATADDGAVADPFAADAERDEVQRDGAR